MKFSKILLTVIGATAMMNLAAFAGDQTLVQVPNGHGQVTVLYRPGTPTVAVFAGKGVGASSSSAQQLVSKDNGHGQATTLFRAQ